MEKIICLVCRSDKVGFFTRKNNYDIYRCQECGLIFVWPLPHKNYHLYSADYFTGAKQGHGYVNYEADKKAANQTLQAFLDKIEKFLPIKGKLLDVGAATGHFLQLAKERGWQARGVELSQYAAEKARASGLDVITGTARDLNLAPEEFDAVTYLDVFEHIADPISELDLVCKLLRKGGLLIINTPDSSSWFARLMGKSWHTFVPPEHLFIYSPKNLTILLKRIGFETAEVCKIGKRFTLQYIFQFLANRYPLFLWRWLAKICKQSFAGKLALPINLRDNFFIIARKRKEI